MRSSKSGLSISRIGKLTKTSISDIRPDDDREIAKKKYTLNCRMQLPMTDFLGSQWSYSDSKGTEIDDSLEKSKRPASLGALDLRDRQARLPRMLVAREAKALCGSAPIVAK